MEIVHLINNTYQVINTSDNTVLYQGSYSDCECYIEDYWYKVFLSMGNI